MKIAILGAGNVGQALGERWRAGGHEVVYALRNPQDRRYAALVAKAPVKDVAAAVQASEAVLLATPWSGAQAAIAAAGDLTGKIVIDATNALAADLSGLTVGPADSAGEQVQRWAKDARVVKAFNTVGANIMVNPTLEGRRVAMYLAGDDPEARKRVAELAREIGFEALEAGELKGARLLEQFAMLWIASAYKFGFGRDFAFSVVRR